MCPISKLTTNVRTFLCITNVLWQSGCPVLLAQMRTKRQEEHGMVSLFSRLQTVGGSAMMYTDYVRIRLVKLEVQGPIVA